MSEATVGVEVYFSAHVEERTDWPLDGSDVIIAKFDLPLLMTKPALVQWALKIGEHSAVSLGTHLHHADFVITNNPATVRKRGISPDHPNCLTCLAGREQALAALAENPDITLAVGQLYWSPFPPASEEAVDG